MHRFSGSSKTAENKTALRMDVIFVGKCYKHETYHDFKVSHIYGRTLSCLVRLPGDKFTLFIDNKFK